MKRYLFLALLIAAQGWAETKTFYISGDDTADYNDMAGGSVLRYGYEYSGYADRRMPDAYGMVDGGQYYSIQDNPSIRVHTQLGVDFAWTDGIDSYGGFFLSFRLANFSAVNLPITAMRLYLPYQLITATKGDKVEINQSKFTRSSRPYSLYMPNIQWWHGYADPARFTWFFWGSVFDRMPLSAYTFANDMYSQLDARGSLRPNYDQLYVTLAPPADPTLWNEWVVDLMGKFPDMPKLTGQHDITFFIRPTANGTDITFSNKASTGTGSYNGAKMRLVVEYGGNPLPSPTITNTPTTGSTPTFTMTPAPPTSTPSPSASFTATRTGTNTATRTATITNTPTATGTATWNPLAPTPTVTQTFTGIPPSPTRTNTAVPTRTNTSTPTNTRTPTVTQTFTATVTNTVTATDTPTATITNTFTRQFSPTITNTPAPTNTNTALPTSTMTWTGQPTATPTKTWTLTATHTRTPTEAVAPTVTATIANLLTSGANGYPAAGAAGYIPKLVVGDLQYDSLSQRNAPQQAAAVSSVYVPGGNSLTSQGLAVGGMSVIGADGNIAFGDSFTVDSAAGDIITRGSLYITGTPNSGNFIKGVSITQDLSHSTNGYGYGVYVEPRGTLGNLLQGLKTNDINFTGTSASHGVAASVSKGTSSNIGFAASVGGTGSSSNIGAELRAGGVTTGTNYGAYCDAWNGATNWALYCDDGNVYIENDITMGANPVINFPNSDALRYTDSTAVLDLYNGSASVFSVDADQGNTVVNGGQLSVSGTMGAGNTLTPMRITASMANASDNTGYSTYIYPYGTLPLTYYHIYSSDAGGTTGAGVSVSLGIYSFVSKGANDNKAIKGVSGGGGSSYNTGGEFIANGASTYPNTAVSGSSTNGKGVQYGGYFSATKGSGTSTTNYGVYATATGGSVANHAGYFDGNVTMTDGDILTTETLSPVDTTGIVLNGATNKITIANDGNMTFAGTATYWDDVVVSGVDVKLAGSSDPTLKAFPTGAATKMYAFPDGTDKEVFTSLQLPHRYKEGSDIGLHIHWSPDAATTNDVVWGCDYTWANVIATPAAFAAPTNTTVTSDGGSLQWGHQIAGFPTITGTGKTISSCIVIRIYRDADNVADTHTGDAFLISIDAHFEADTLGSNTTIGK